MPDEPVSRHDALATALEAVGDRWAMLIVAALLERPRRFGDLERELEGIAPNVLTSRLRALEDAAVVVAEAYSERPPRFLYSLTASGVELAGAIRLLADWGARRREGSTPVRHAACGTPLEARLWCPTCERAVEAPETDELHYA